MKLHDVPNYSYIRVLGEVKTPMEGIETFHGDVLKFLKIDGMYSRCANSDGDIVHLVAWAEVEIVNECDVEWRKQ